MTPKSGERYCSAHEGAIVIEVLLVTKWTVRSLIVAGRGDVGSTITDTHDEFRMFWRPYRAH